MRVSTFPRVFCVVLLLWVASVAAVFTARGDLAWAAGFLFLAYDTWLLSRLIAWSRRALNEESAERSRQLVSPLEPGEPPAERLTMTVLVPARNEAVILPFCLDALLAQGDRPERLLVIDDGSEDGTAHMLAARYPQVEVWSKPSTGKANSFNEILPSCETDLVVTIDADTVLDPGSLQAIREAFSRAPSLVAGCGVLRPRCQGGRLAGFFGFFQRFEYLRAFLWRLAWSRINALVLVSGAFAVYRRDVLEDLGGFDSESWVEDYEVLYRLHRRAGDAASPWRVAVIPGARAVTDAPGRPGQFLRQRARWFGGFIATLFANRDMVGNGRFGAMGRVLLPVKTVDTLLPFFAATTQLSLIYLLVRGGFLDGLVLAVLAAKFFLDLILHAWALKLYHRWLGLPLAPGLLFQSVLASLLEPFCFQPLRYLGALSGWLAFLRRRLTWDSQRLTPGTLTVREEN